VNDGVATAVRSPEVPSSLIDWTADWVARGMPSLGKDTHFEVRNGNY
jgi:hypothetical protein